MVLAGVSLGLSPGTPCVGRFALHTCMRCGFAGSLSALMRTAAASAVAANAATV